MFTLFNDESIDNDFSNALHNGLLALAEFKSLNENDPITQDLIDDDKRVFVSTGHQFDIYALIEYHNKRDYRGSSGEQSDEKRLSNPITNLPFNKNDVNHIQIFAESKGLEIEDLQQESYFSSRHSSQQDNNSDHDEESFPYFPTYEDYPSGYNSSSSQSIYSNSNYNNSFWTSQQTSERNNSLDSLERYNEEYYFESNVLNVLSRMT